MQSPKKSLYLHIGLHKTGTTSIQDFLLKNRDALLSSGLLYPKLNLNIFYHHFIGRYFDDDNRSPWLMGKFGNDKEQLKNSVDEIKAQMLSTNAKIIILSSESFIDSNPEKLKSYFSEFDIKIIVFIRRQDLWLESKVNQHFKMNREHSTERNRKALLNDRRCDYKALLQPFENIYGKENIILRPFQKSLFSIKTLEQYFIELMDIEYNSKWVISSRSNQKLKRSAIAFIEKQDIRVKFTNNIYRKFIFLLEKFSLENPDPAKYKYFFSPKERLQLIDKHQENNDYVSNHYLNVPLNDFFTDPKPQLSEKWESYEELTVEEEQQIQSFLKKNKFYLFLLKNADSNGNFKLNKLDKWKYYLIRKFNKLKSISPQ